METEKDMLKEIRSGVTPVLIKHKEKNLYLTIVTRKGWPAATLGTSTDWYFLLIYSESGVRIKAVNTTSPGYEMLYSSVQGGIYFDQWSDNSKQLWTISKNPPLYDGDVVSFKNKNWENSGLCFYEGSATDVYCLRDKADEWVLVAYKDYRGEAKTVEVPSKWNMIFEYTNGTDFPIEQTSKYVEGFKTSHKDEKNVIAKHSVGGVLNVNEPFNIASLEVSYTYENTTQNITMKEKEIYSSEEYSFQVTIPPKKRLTRWQLFADVAGNDVGYKSLTDLDEGEPIPASNSRATIVLPQQIRSGVIPVRIRHKEKNLFMTVVTRKEWPAATLGLSSDFYFLLFFSDDGVRIKALNTTTPGHDILYSSDQGGVYFDQWSDDPKQLWMLSKNTPLYDGDVVSFKNKNWSNSGLCYYEGPATNIYCLNQKEDEWIIMG